MGCEHRRAALDPQAEACATWLGSAVVAWWGSAVVAWLGSAFVACWGAGRADTVVVIKISYGGFWANLKPPEGITEPRGGLFWVIFGLCIGGRSFVFLVPVG